MGLWNHQFHNTWCVPLSGLSKTILRRNLFTFDELASQWEIISINCKISQFWAVNLQFNWLSQSSKNTNFIQAFLLNFQVSGRFSMLIWNPYNKKLVDCVIYYFYFSITFFFWINWRINLKKLNQNSRWNLRTSSIFEDATYIYRNI